jgi:hypothetical protein
MLHATRTGTSKSARSVRGKPHGQARGRIRTYGSARTYVRIAAHAVTPPRGQPQMTRSVRTGVRSPYVSDPHCFNPENSQPDGGKHSNLTKIAATMPFWCCARMALRSHVFPVEALVYFRHERYRKHHILRTGRLVGK